MFPTLIHQHLYTFLSLKHIYLKLNYLLTSNSVPLNKGLSPERLSATRTHHTGLQSNISSGSSCRPLNMEAWVRYQMSTCGICDGLSGTGTIFLQGLQFCPVSVILALHTPFIHLSPKLHYLSNCQHY
jgi:hypothetical protein